MFVNTRKFADLVDTADDAPSGSQRQRYDPIEMMSVIDEADRSLLRLVFCAAVATLLLALAASLVV